MVERKRKLGIKGYIRPTEKRIKSEILRKRKTDLGIECFWTISDASTYFDDEVLKNLE